MRKKLTRTGNSLALVLDKKMLEELGIDAGTPLEVSTDGRVVVVAPVRSGRRQRRLKDVVERAHARYAGVFRTLAK